MTSLTARTASSNSSARQPCRHQPFSQPSIPHCYCDLETSPRAEGHTWQKLEASSAAGAGWEAGHGPACFSLHSPQPPGFSLPLRLSPGCPLFSTQVWSLEDPTSHHMFPWKGLARPAPLSGAMCTHFSSGAGWGGSRSAGVSFYTYSPPNLIIPRVLGDSHLPPHNASINPLTHRQKCPRTYVFLPSVSPGLG